jgi:hypothetical protein
VTAVSIKRQTEVRPEVQWALIEGAILGMVSRECGQMLNPSESRFIKLKAKCLQRYETDEAFREEIRREAVKVAAENL